MGKSLGSVEEFDRAELTPIAEITIP